MNENAMTTFPSTLPGRPVPAYSQSDEEGGYDVRSLSAARRSLHLQPGADLLDPFKRAVTFVAEQRLVTPRVSGI
jgi:hypothetical protein